MSLVDSGGGKLAAPRIYAPACVCFSFDVDPGAGTDQVFSCIEVCCQAWPHCSRAGGFCPTQRFRIFPALLFLAGGFALWLLFLPPLRSRTGSAGRWLPPAPGPGFVFVCGVWFFFGSLVSSFISFLCVRAV